MNTHITLSQAIEGYLLDANARRLSPRTITTYLQIFHRFQDYLGDVLLTEISPDDIRRFLNHLASAPIIPSSPIARPPRTLSDKTIHNHHIALSALWTWATKEGFTTHHIVRAVDRPQFEQRAIHPYSRQDIEAMLTACNRSQPYIRPGKRECTHARTTASRDRAIILLLTDTGLRASELAADPRRQTPGLRIQHLDQRNLQITVFGKGDKERLLPICHQTLKATWRYLVTRPDAIPADPLFLSKQKGPLTTSGLYQLTHRLGQRAGILNAHPHRFRHTFAINFLRNGGNIYALQRMLGHTTLEMVKRYLELAQTDIENAHRRASPVANWNL